MLHRELKPSLHFKRGKLSKEILSHNKAQPHTAAHTFETLKKLKWETIINSIGNKLVYPWVTEGTLRGFKQPHNRKKVFLILVFDMLFE
jgi:hypothetical protein